MKALLTLLVCLFIAAGLYTAARLHRYEISHGGSDRYYVVIKLDRWTGESWKLATGSVWEPITPAQP